MENEPTPQDKIISIADLESPTLDLRDDGEPAVFLGAVGLLPEFAEKVALAILAKCREYEASAL